MDKIYTSPLLISIIDPFLCLDWNFHLRVYVIGVKEDKMKNKYVAAILAIFLGDLGLHKFYTGDWIWGLIYLAFSWTFIPAFIGIIEGLFYIFESEDSWNRRVNKMYVQRLEHRAAI